MYIKDGIAYAGSPSTGIKVVSAKVVNELSMLVTFSTGETRLFDASELLTRPAFRDLAREAVFESYRLDHGVITWENGDIDIAPETVYAMSYEYETVA